jgi:hypothetical protein
MEPGNCRKSEWPYFPIGYNKNERKLHSVASNEVLGGGVLNRFLLIIPLAIFRSAVILRAMLIRPFTR